MTIGPLIDEVVHDQVVSALHAAEQPISSEELQHFLSERTNLYVITDILHLHLALLERCPACQGELSPLVHSKSA